MTIEQAISQITQLPVADQLRIINTIWDSMPDCAATEPSEIQRQELDRRMEKYSQDPSTALTESQLRDKLRARREGL